MPFSADFLRTLERLYLLAHKRMTREQQGDRPSTRRGASIEFADYRHYTPGDEVRYIDWNVYARHGSLFVKEFSAEESVHVVLLLDSSASMKFGNPPKIDSAREVAAALGYIGLISFDSVSLYSFAEQIRERRTFLRGKPQVFDLLSALEEVRPEGRTNFRTALRLPPPKLKGRSVLLMVTDFYDPAYAESLRELRSRGYQVHLIHIVAPEEQEPTLRGRQALVDLESGDRRDIVITGNLLDRYRRRFARYCAELEHFCAGNEMRYVRIRSDAPLEERVMEILRKGGILELR